MWTPAHNLQILQERVARARRSIEKRMTLFGGAVDQIWYFGKPRLRYMFTAAHGRLRVALRCHVMATQIPTFWYDEEQV